MMEEERKPAQFCKCGYGLCDTNCVAANETDCPKAKRAKCAFTNGQPCRLECKHADNIKEGCAQVTATQAKYSPALNATLCDSHWFANWFAMAESEYRDLKDGGRGNYLGFPAAEKLDHCCGILYSAFGTHCYLVGSATETKKFRDVDVRMMLEDAQYNLLFGTSSISPLWSVLSVSISAWLSSQTGLPVDFQFQKVSVANKTYKGHTRNALGIGTRIHLEDDQLPFFLRGEPAD